MRRLARFAIAFSTAVSVSAPAAVVYRYVDDQGTVHYTDDPGRVPGSAHPTPYDTMPTTDPVKVGTAPRSLLDRIFDILARSGPASTTHVETRSNPQSGGSSAGPGAGPAQVNLTSGRSSQTRQAAGVPTTSQPSPIDPNLIRAQLRNVGSNAQAAALAVLLAAWYSGLLASSFGLALLSAVTIVLWRLAAHDDRRGLMWTWRLGALGACWAMAQFALRPAIAAYRPTLSAILAAAAGLH